MRYGFLDHLWGALLGLSVGAVLMMLAVVVVTLVSSGWELGEVNLGELFATALLFGLSLLVVGAVVVLVIGLPLGAALSRALRPVRHRWVHVLVFALAGGFTGGVFLPVLLSAFSGELSWVWLAELPTTLGSFWSQAVIWSGVVVAGVGRLLGMRSAERAARPELQDRRECLLDSRRR